MLRRPSSSPDDDLEIELGDLDGRDGGQSQAILTGEVSRQDGSWRVHLRGHGWLPYGGVILLLLVLLLGVAPSRRDGTALAITVGPGARLARAGMPGAIYIEPGVPWARLSVDGYPLPDIPRYGGAVALYLTRGTHQLEWRALPFAMVTCTLSHPDGPGDTCQRFEVVDGSTPGVMSTIASFQPSLTLLPTRLRGELVAAIQRALDAQTATATVAPGERYVDGDGSLPLALWAREPVATTPLVATLRLRLVSDLDGAQTCHIEVSESCVQFGQDCRFLCTSPAKGNRDAWQVVAIVRGLWTFATPSGRNVVADAPDGLAGAGTAVSLHLKWTGGAWRVALSYFQTTLPGPGQSPPAQLSGFPGCTWLQTELVAQAFATASPGSDQALTWRIASAPPGATGCLAIGIGATNASASGGATLGGAYLLQRFGVILAANDLAHQRWPFLPVASADARHLAASLAATQFPRA
jgi:hypothetical protein